MTPRDLFLTIIVNGRKKKIAKTVVTHDDIVSLSGIEHNQKTIFTITFSRGEGCPGSLTRGEEVRVIDGMLFDATPTGQA